MRLAAPLAKDSFGATRGVKGSVSDGEKGTANIEVGEGEILPEQTETLCHELKCALVGWKLI